MTGAVPIYMSEPCILVVFDAPLVHFLAQYPFFFVLEAGAACVDQPVAEVLTVAVLC